MEIILYTLLGLTYFGVFCLLYAFIHLVKGRMSLVSFIFTLLWPLSMPIYTLIAIFYVLLRKHFKEISGG